MKLVLLFVFVSIAFGLPCTQPINSTMLPTGVLQCNSINPIIIGTDTRYCNMVVSTGNSVYFAFVLTDNNAQLTDLQFGITVQAINATSLDDSNFIQVYISSTACPTSSCPHADNVFENACGYDFMLGYGDLSYVTQPLTAGYGNAGDGVYYIQVSGPIDGTTGAVTVAFDIQIDDGTRTIAYYVPPISVLLFVFVFAMVIVGVFYFKKTHGGWKEEPMVKDLVPSKANKSLSSAELLRQEGSMVGRTESLVSLESVVTLFREQTAAINRLSETAVVINDVPKAHQEAPSNKPEIEEEISPQLTHKEGRAARKIDSFVLPSDSSSSSSSDEEKK